MKQVKGDAMIRRADNSSIPRQARGRVRERLPRRNRLGCGRRRRAADGLGCQGDAGRRSTDLGKPLHAVLLTHSHPDHYAGLVEIVAGDDLPIVAPQGVIDTITADDPMKDQLVGPMFGDDWPTSRVFPNTPIRDGESLTFDGAKFTVIDLGPSESPHDSPWVLGRRRADRLPRRPDLRPQALLPRRRLLRRVAGEHRDAPRRASPTTPSSISVTAAR